MGKKKLSAHRNWLGYARNMKSLTCGCGAVSIATSDWYATAEWRQAQFTDRARACGPCRNAAAGRPVSAELDGLAQKEAALFGEIDRRRRVLALWQNSSVHDDDRSRLDIELRDLAQQHAEVKLRVEDILKGEMECVSKS